MKLLRMIILIVACPASIAPCRENAAGATVRVGGGNGAALASAIAAASPGDTILVGPGTYAVEDAFYLEKSLHIIGEAGPAATVIANYSVSHGVGSPMCGSGGFVAIDVAHGFTIDGFTIRNHRSGDYDCAFWGGWGIYAFGSSGTIRNNVFLANEMGLLIGRGCDVVIRDNLMDGNSMGVQLAEVTHAEICFNTMRGSSDGVTIGYFVAPTDVVIRNNIFDGFYYGVRNHTEGLETISIRCNDFWNIGASDCCGCSIPCAGSNGNISADPNFCNGYYLHLGSPCLPGNTPEPCGGEHMGCYPIACEVGTERTSWGSIKNIFR